MTRFGMAFFGDGSRFGESGSPPPTSGTTAMASNNLPRKLDRLFALCEDMLTGLLDHEVDLEIEQNTHAKLSPALAAARAAETAYGDSKTARKAANAVVNTADAAAKVFISNARRRFGMFFGERYSTEWAAAGWPNGSTAVPGTQAG
jgi:hypothetical protein